MISIVIYVFSPHPRLVYPCNPVGFIIFNLAIDLTDHSALRCGQLSFFSLGECFLSYKDLTFCMRSTP